MEYSQWIVETFTKKVQRLIRMGIQAVNVVIVSIRKYLYEAKDKNYILSG